MGSTDQVKQRMPTEKTPASLSGRYGFLAWVGFWSAWPYVLYARAAWRKPGLADAVHVVEAAIRKA